jgi:hypothetical protein
MVILSTSDFQEPSVSSTLTANSPGISIERLEPGVPLPITETFTSTQILKTTFSSIPVVWESNLVQEYQELGAALIEMTELDDQSQWRIEPPVYEAACLIAQGLMNNLWPAPRVFTHGPQSVVFNWPVNTDNLYLTVSADKVSVLISSPERIKARIEFSGTALRNPSLLLSSVRSAQFEQPVSRRLNGAIANPFEFVE